MNRRNNRRSTESTPKFMESKFAGTCAETGKPIAKGANILYANGKAYCEDSRFYSDFKSAEWDLVMLGGNCN